MCVSGVCVSVCDVYVSGVWGKYWCVLCKCVTLRGRCVCVSKWFCGVVVLRARCVEGK